MSLPVKRQTNVGRLDYMFQYEDFLGQDIITSSVLSADAGITISDELVNDRSVEFFVSGGEINQQYEISNTITTQGGRTAKRCFVIHIVECL